MLGRRKESVPFTFIAEADRFRGDAPPPKPRATTAEIAGRVLVGLVVTAGITGSLLFGLPSLEVDSGRPGTAQHSKTVQDD